MASNGDQLTADDSAASNTNTLLDLGFDDFTTPSTTVDQTVNNQDSLLDIGAGDFFTAQQPVQSSENNSSSLLDFFTSDNSQPPPQQQEDKVGAAGADDLLGFFSGSGTQAQSEDNNPPSSSDVFSNDSFDNLSASYGSAGISGGETDLFSLSDPTPNPGVNEAPAQLDLLGLEQNQSAGNLLQSDQGDLLFSSQSTEQHAEESSLGNFDSQVQLDQNDLLFSTQPGTNEAINTQETLVGDLLSSSDSQSQSNLLSAQPFVTSEQNLENLQDNLIGDTANNPDSQSDLLFATQPSQDIEQTKQLENQQESLVGDIQNSSDNQLQLDQSDLLFSAQPTEPESSQENLLEDLTSNSQNLLSAQPFVTPEPNIQNVQEYLIGSIANNSDNQDQGDLLFVSQTSDQNTESEKQQVVGDLTNSSNLDPDQNNLLFSAHPAQTTEENHEVENSDTNLVGDLLSSSDSQSQPNLLSAQPFVTSEQNLENLQKDSANNPDIQLDQSDLLSTSQPAETTEPESSQENLLEDLTNNSQNLLSAQPFVTPEPNKEIENVQEDLVGDLLNNSDNQLQLDQSDLLFSTQASEQNTESEKQQENFVGDLTNSSSLESDQNNLLFSAQPIQTTEPDNQQDSLIENLANDSSFSESNQDNLLFSDQLISTTVDSNYPASNNTANQDLLGFFGGSTGEVLTEASSEQSVSTTTNTDNIFADFTSTSQEEASSNDLLNVSTSSDVKQNNNLNYDIFSTGSPSENAMNPEPSINPEDDTISTNQNIEPEDQQEDVVEDVTNDSSLSDPNQDGSLVSNQLTGTTEENKTSENELDGGQENDMMTSSEGQEVDEPISSEVTQQSSDEPNDCLSFSYSNQVSNTEANQESNQESELNVQESSENMILDESCYGASDSDDDSAPNNENSQIPRNMSPVSMEFEENFYIGSSGYQSTPAPFKPQRSSSSSENNNGGNKTLQSTIYFGSDDSYSESDGVLSPDESGGGVGSRFVDIQASYDEYSDSPLQVMSAGSSGSQSTSVLDLYGDSEWEEVASQIPRINTLPVIDEVTESEDNNDDDEKMTSQIYDYSPSHVSDDNDSDHSSSVTTSPRVDNDVINQETASNSGSDVTATCEDSLEDEASTAKSSRAGSLLEDNSSAQDQSPVEHFHETNVEISHDSEVDANIPETSADDVTLPEVSEQVENSKSQGPEEADVMMSIPDVVSDQLTGTTEENKTSENELHGGQESSEDQEVDKPISSEVTQQSSDEPNDIVAHSRKSSSSSSSSSSSGDEDQVIFDDEEEGTEEVGFKQEINEINNQETPDQDDDDEETFEQQQSVEIKQADLYDDEKVELDEHHQENQNVDDEVSTSRNLVGNFEEANSQDIFSDNSESNPIETSLISDGLLDLGGVEHHEDQDTINKEDLEQGELNEDTYQESHKQDNIFAEDNQASNTNVETVDVLSSFEEIKSDDIFSDNSESAQPNESANQSLDGLLDLTGSTTSNDTNQIFSDASNTEHDSNEVNTGETQNVETSNDFMGMFGDESTNAATTETNLLNDESPDLNMMRMDSAIGGELLDMEPQLDTLVHGLVTEVIDEALTSTQLLGEEPTLMTDTNDDGLIVAAQEVVTEVVDHVLNNNLVGLETNQESDIFDAAHVQPQSTSMDDAFFTGGQEASVDKASVDEASVDGASVDGASVDGASVDKASVDGASVDRASVDEASVDGASVDGASVDGASVDGAKTTQRKSVRFVSEGENIFDVSDDHEPQPEVSVDSNSLLNVNEIEADAVQDSDSSLSSSEESNEGISQQQLADQLIDDQANNVDTKEQVVIVLNDQEVNKSGEEEETASEISCTDQQMISNLHNNNIISSGKLDPTTPLNTPLQSDGTLDEIFDNTDDDQHHLPIVAPRRKKKPTMEQTAPLSGDGFAEDIFAADDHVKETKVEDSVVEPRHHESGLLNEDFGANDVQTWNTQQEEEKAANVEDENIFKMEDVDSNLSSSSSSSSDNSEHSDQLMEDLSEKDDKETNISQVHISDNIFDPEISDNLTTGQNDIHKEANILETDEISEEPVSIPGVDDIFTDSQNEENAEISNDFVNSNLMSELEPQQQESSLNIVDNIQVENDANIFQIDQQLATSLPEVPDPFNSSASNPILDEEVKTSDDLMDSDQISGFTQDQEMSTNLTTDKIDNKNEENIFDLDGEVSEEPLSAALPEAQDLFNNSISNPILDEEVKLSDNLMDSDHIPGFTQDQELSIDVSTDKNEVEKDENIFQLDEVSEQQFTNSPPEVQDPFNDLAQASQHEEEVEVSEELKDSEQVVKEEKTNEGHPEQKETEEVKETTLKPPKATVSRVASLRRRITVDVMEEVKTSDDEDVTRRKGERERFDTIGSLELLTDDSDEESAGKPKQLIASKEDPIPDDPEPPSEDGTGVLVSLSDNDPPVPGGRLKKRKSLVPPSSLLLSVALDDIGAPAPSLSPATEEPPQSDEADPTVEAKEETENMDEDGVKNETMTVSTGTDVINTSSTTYVDKGSNLAQLQLPANMDEANVIWDEVVINKETYKIDGGCLQPYKRLVCHGGFYKERCTIVEIFGQYLPDSSTPNYTWIMDNIFMYLLSTVQLLAGENKFAIVFFNTNVSRSAIPGSNLLKKFHSLVPYELRKKMESCYVIQPSFTLKTTIRFSRFLSRKAIQKIVYVKSYPELKSYLPTEFLYIPDDILGSQK